MYECMSEVESTKTARTEGGRVRCCGCSGVGRMARGRSNKDL